MPTDFFSLPINDHLSSSVSLRTCNQIDILVIENKFFQAAISIQGSQVLFFKRRDEPLPLIWLSKTCDFVKGVPIRGGVPICWPWFTDLGGEPFHGFARILNWKLVDIKDDEENISLHLSLTDNDFTHSIWDHDFILDVIIEFNKFGMSIELSSLGNYSATAALHTYLNVKDILSCRTYGLGNQFFDTVKNVPNCTASVPFVCEGDTGGIFSDAHSTTILTDDLCKRNVVVSHFNNSDVVFWNPGLEKTKSIDDIDDEEFRYFICIETACVTLPLITTETGSHCFGFKLYSSLIEDSV